MHAATDLLGRWTVMWTATSYKSIQTRRLILLIQTPRTSYWHHGLRRRRTLLPLQYSLAHALVESLSRLETNSGVLREPSQALWTLSRSICPRAYQDCTTRLWQSQHMHALLARKYTARKLSALENVSECRSGQKNQRLMVRHRQDLHRFAVSSHLKGISLWLLG